MDLARYVRLSTAVAAAETFVFSSTATMATNKLQLTILSHVTIYLQNLKNRERMTFNGKSGGGYSGRNNSGGGGGDNGGNGGGGPHHHHSQHPLNALASGGLQAPINSSSSNQQQIQQQQQQFAAAMIQRNSAYAAATMMAHHNQYAALVQMQNPHPSAVVEMATTGYAYGGAGFPPFPPSGYHHQQQQLHSPPPPPPPPSSLPTGNNHHHHHNAQSSSSTSAVSDSLKVKCSIIWMITLHTHGTPTISSLTFAFESHLHRCSAIVSSGSDLFSSSSATFHWQQW